MHVDLRLVWQFVIEHVRDVLHVDASAGDVRGHEDGDVALTEGLKGANPGGLAFVAVNGLGRDAGLLKLLCQPVGAVLGAGEHDSTIHHFRLDQVRQKASLVRFSHKSHALFDAVGGRLLGTDVYPYWVVKHLGDQIVRLGVLFTSNRTSF